MMRSIKFFILVLALVSSISVHSKEKGRIIKKKGHNVSVLTFSPDNNHLATGGSNNEIVIWDLNTGVEVTSLKGHDQRILSIAYSPDGKFIASGAKDNKIIVWSAERGTKVHEFDAHKGGTTTLEFTYDGLFLYSGGVDKNVYMWDLFSKEIVDSIQAHTSPVSNISLNYTNEYLASVGYDGKVNIWTTSKNEQYKSYTPTILKIRAVTFHPMKNEFAIGSDDKTIRIYDLKTNTIVKTLNGAKGAITNLKYSNDGKYLISLSLDNKLRVWDLETAKVKVSHEGFYKLWNSCVSNNGNFMAACDLSSNVRILDLSSFEFGPKVFYDPSLDFNANTSSETVDFEFDPAEKGKNYLLVIGVSEYKNWNKLANAKKDAQDVKKLLNGKYEFDKENIYELYDSEVTLLGLTKMFKMLKEKITSKDRLLVYYSGHGFYNTSIEEGYWVPFDAKTNTETDYFSNSILLKYMSAIDTKHTFMVIDACFSGSLFSSTHRGFLDNKDAIKSRWALTSGGEEYVEDGKEGENSPFCKYFLKYLKDNSLSKFAVSQLIQYVVVAVGDNSNQQPVGNPLKGVGHEGGEFVFQKRVQ